VSQLTSGPLVIVANPSLPAKNVKELIAIGKAKPGSLNYASSGNGQSTHLSAELFATMAGIKMNHFPYKGSAPALTDVMGGQASLMFDTMLSAMPHVKNGKLKAIAVTSAARSPAAPEVPTVAESGLPGYEAIAWNGLLVPAGTPADVAGKLNAELKEGARCAGRQGSLLCAGLRRRVEHARGVREIHPVRARQVGEGRKRYRARRSTDIMITYQALKSWQFPQIEHAYTADDSMLYALAVGVGADPLDERQLKFVNDTAPGTPLALPTMAVILGYPGSWMRDPQTGIDFSMIVHGEEQVVLHKPLPAAGTVVARHRVTRIVDKGAGKGATVTYDKELFDKSSGDKLANRDAYDVLPRRWRLLRARRS
jgi:hypothetical protein